jgi:hypothetical protein
MVTNLHTPVAWEVQCTWDYSLYQDRALSTQVYDRYRVVVSLGAGNLEQAVKVLTCDEGAVIFYIGRTTDPRACIHIEF